MTLLRGPLHPARRPASALSPGGLEILLALHYGRMTLYLLKIRDAPPAACHTTRADDDNTIEPGFPLSSSSFIAGGRSCALRKLPQLR
jgi:hypothetical protein